MSMETQGWRTWIDIDLDALTDNYRTACSLTGATVTCVLKANAYGHGAVPCALALQRAGCASFAVSCGREALELRAGGVTGELLVMAWPEPCLLRQLVEAEIVFTVSAMEELQALEQAAASAGRRAKAHIKADTGFHRLGFPCTQESAKALAEAARTMPHVALCGLYSHLGLVTEERDARQHQLLLSMRDWLAASGLALDDIHLCDSIGLVRYPQWHHSRCRVGSLLFGMRPSRSEGMPFQLKETLVFRARVAQLHDVPAGEVIGYDESGATTRPMRVATVCAGYGDGYPRCLSGKGEVLIRGQRAPVLGLVCMDQLMVDVSRIPGCAAGDTATLLGGGIPCAEYAAWAQTNRNECLSILSRRPVRRYFQGGRLTGEWDQLLTGGTGGNLQE